MENSDKGLYLLHEAFQQGLCVSAYCRARGDDKDQQTDCWKPEKQTKNHSVSHSMLKTDGFQWPEQL